MKHEAIAYTISAGGFHYIECMCKHEVIGNTDTFAITQFADHVSRARFLAAETERAMIEKFPRL